MRKLNWRWSFVISVVLIVIGDAQRGDAQMICAGPYQGAITIYDPPDEIPCFLIRNKPSYTIKCYIEGSPLCTLNALICLKDSNTGETYDSFANLSGGGATRIYFNLTLDTTRWCFKRPVNLEVMACTSAAATGPNPTCQQICTYPGYPSRKTLFV